MNHCFSKIILCLTGMMMSGVSASAQGAIDVVREYNSNLRGFILDGDVENLENIDEMLRGGDVKCVINNRIAQDFADEKHWSKMTMHSDTYHNELSNRHDDGRISSIELSDYALLTDWVEPRINTGDFALPTMFISARMKVTGKDSYDIQDLFFVQGNHIVMIDDFGGNESVGKGIEYYNRKNYAEAFRIFRNQAYASRQSRLAQYYYCVMLIKGQGCGHLPKKVRDMEAAWFALSGFKAGHKDLHDLAVKFSMKVKYCDFNSVWAYAPSYDGRRTIRDKNRYGIMDDNGRMVVPLRQGYCSPFSSQGYATLSMDGSKWGLMDSNGNQVIPFDYYNIVPFLVDDKFMAIKNKKLYILNKTGVPIKIIDGDFVEVRFVTEDNLAVVLNGKEGAMRAELYDFSGNLIDGGSDYNGDVTHSFQTGEVRFTDRGEKKPRHLHKIRW